MIAEQKIRNQAAEEKVSISLVFKEYVHLAVLDYLFKKGLFSSLVFQGGTALRLAYNGLRYSEDLDFVLTAKNTARFSKLEQQLKPLAAYIKRLIPFVQKATLNAQKQTNTFKRYHLILETTLLNAKDRTNIEIANIPSYKYQTLILHKPDIILSPAVRVETPAEILTDKILAFAARNYLKGRDLWDIYFLLNTLKITIDSEITKMLIKKIADYELSYSKFLGAFEQNLTILKTQGFLLLQQEMDKFLPQAYRDSFQSLYPDICQTELNIFNKLFKELKNDNPELA